MELWDLKAVTGRACMPIAEGLTTEERQAMLKILGSKAPRDVTIIARRTPEDRYAELAEKHGRIVEVTW